MAVKYKIEYKNHVGDQFQILISNDEYAGDPIDVRGHANITKPKTKILHALRGRGLRLFLEASIDLDFTDLYSDKETDFKVDFYRNGIKLFKGFVKPEGLYADFVSDKWEITLDCIDGLGILKNLRFVKEDGTYFQGLMTEFDIIYSCLKRTSLNLPINTKIGITRAYVGRGRYSPRDSSGIADVLKKTKLNTERFYDEAGDSEADILDCEKVLKSTLEKYNAVVEQHNGEWFIYRPIEFAGEDFKPQQQGYFLFHRYEDGIFVNQRSIGIKKSIGSQIKGFYPHHANENQRISINGAVSAFRVKYEYGLVKKLLTYSDFKYDPDTNTVRGWKTNRGSSFVPYYWGLGEGLGDFIGNNEQKGIQWRLIDHPAGFRDVINLRLRQPIAVAENDFLKIITQYSSFGKVLGLKLNIKIVYDGKIKYFTNQNELNEDNGWQDSFSYYYLGFNPNNPEPQPAYRRETYVWGSTEEIEPLGKTTLDLAIIGTGKVYIDIYTPAVQPESEWISEISIRDYGRLNYLQIEPTDQNQTIEGEWHTAYRKPAISSNVGDTLEVFNGDMDTDVYVGAIKNMYGLNTSTWNHIGVDEDESILEIMVKDRIRIQSKPQKVFTGDVYGYIPGLSLLNIDNLPGNFYPVGYEYDSLNNICKFESNEIFDDKLEGEIYYEPTFDRNKVIKPTII